MQVRSSDIHVTASLCGYSTVGKVWTLFVYVNDGNGASAMRCIVNIYFLAFIEWTSIFYFCESIWNNTFKEKYLAMIYPLRLTSKISWCWNKLKKCKMMKVCNYKPILIITCFSMYYGLVKWKKNILKQQLQHYPNM